MHANVRASAHVCVCVRAGGCVCMCVCVRVHVPVQQTGDEVDDADPAICWLKYKAIPSWQKQPLG